MRVPHVVLLLICTAVAAAAGALWWDRVRSEAPPSHPLHRVVVLESLYDPASANFRNEFRGGTRTVWCGEVNAKNRMGGYTGFVRYIVLVDPAAAAEPARATLYLDQSATDDDSFRGRWSVYCMN
jgi:hypothetical protein